MARCRQLRERIRTKASQRRRIRALTEVRLRSRNKIIQRSTQGRSLGHAQLAKPCPSTLISAISTYPRSWIARKYLNLKRLDWQLVCILDRGKRLAALSYWEEI